jgi:hypothetical protein
MGVFDNVKCSFPLPWPEVQDARWQSYDTPDQYQASYEIRGDGTLWRRDGVAWFPVSVEGGLEIHTMLAGVEFAAHFWFRDGQVRDVIFKRTPEGAADEQ